MYGMRGNFLPLLIVYTLNAQFILGELPLNYFLGTCLDDKWVKEMELDLGVSALDRGVLGRLIHPFLKKSRTLRRFEINDPRTATSMESLYHPDCAESSGKFYGVNITVDANGQIINGSRGYADKAFVLETNGWATHSLVTQVVAILAYEVLGYDVAIYSIGSTDLMDQRMSSVHMGLCTPTHVNLEVWETQSLDTYLNETYNAGGIGYVGLSGLYTTVDFTTQGRDKSKYSTPFFAEFWRDYVSNTELLDELAVSNLMGNAKYYPPNESGCVDGESGCLNSCSKTESCTAWEADGKECMVIAMMYDYYDSGQKEALIANLNIPSYFCFLGYSGMQEYVIEAEKNKVPVVFYHWEPDPFHYQFDTPKFERIFFPRATPERLAVNTHKFGENGYGKKTNNKVACDFGATFLKKLASSVLQDQQPISDLVSRASLSVADIEQLLKVYVANNKLSGVKDPIFESACTWVKQNYASWKVWLNRLPLCGFETHMNYDIRYCEDENDGILNVAVENTNPSKPPVVTPREISFGWVDPDPENSSKPYKCDGGYLTLPENIRTSRTCSWIKENFHLWKVWVDHPPVCDSSFYSYNVPSCDDSETTSAGRIATFHWLLPQPNNPLLSDECTLALKNSTIDSHLKVLPSPVVVPCDYVPLHISVFNVVVTLEVLIAIILIGAMIFVYNFKSKPIIKRSQYQFLELMLLGGVMMSFTPYFYAGKPTTFRCAARPTMLSLSFTLIFGSLVVKSLRVYRVFLSSSMKKVVLPTKTMFKILLLFIGIDLFILAAWFIIDFPEPTTKWKQIVELNGGFIEQSLCQSSSPIFSAILIFWKAIVLATEIYVSYYIRNVSSDFQETFWINASAIVVLFGCMGVLPLAYLVEMPAHIFFLFLSLSLLGCTITVMGLMLIPKLIRLDAVSVQSSNGTKTSGTAISVSKASTTTKMSQASKNSTASQHSTNSSRETSQLAEATISSINRATINQAVVETIVEPIGNFSESDT